MDTLSQIAHTLLYEGYVLWPYRRSAIKNQQRWTFGGVYPHAFAAGSGGADRDSVRTECLVEGEPGVRVDVSIRFLHVVARQVMASDECGGVTPVDELTVGTRRIMSWDEATERAMHASLTLPDVHASFERPLVIEAGAAREVLTSPNGASAGEIVRSWERLDATVRCAATRIVNGDGRPVYRIAVAVTNDSHWRGTARADAVRRTLVSTHVVLRSDAGQFVSLTDPPGGFAAAAKACANVGLWPVLVGDDGARDTMLASPLILYDYPRVAPESPGDLFDGGEIDQLLILNILTLTEAEQREMRDCDPRAREILDRCSALSTDELMRLHGTVRSMKPVFDNIEAAP